MRIGHGYDVHRFAPGRKLMLCGVEIPFAQGLLGHSDADVALHALMDALLGALALGDIGRLFPDGDACYRGADSAILLQRVMERVEKSGYRLGNCDITIVAQVPKLAPYIDAMQRRVADLCGTETDRVSIKATTEEGLGFTGQQLGMAAHAVCLLEKTDRTHPAER